jgi:hypothetical protein
VDGKVRLQTEILAYTGQQLIPDPTTLDIRGTIHPRGKRSLLDLGSATAMGWRVF